MPTYDYKCDACEFRFERFQSITAEPIRKCPSCGKLRVRRLISAGAGLIFKGSGFYITDYRSDGYKNAAKSESGSGESKPSGDGAASTPSSTPAANPKPASGSSSSSASSNKSDSKKKRT